MDAVVLDMAKLSQGSVVQAAEQMFTLVPLGAALEAEVKIDALDIGYIKAGDVVICFNFRTDQLPSCCVTIAFVQPGHRSGIAVTSHVCPRNFIRSPPFPADRTTPATAPFRYTAR